MDISYVAKTFNVARALLVGKVVDKKRMKARMMICKDCHHVKLQGQLLRCGICNCKVNDYNLVNLARFEETNVYGCKHEEGSQWKKAGV